MPNVTCIEPFVYDGGYVGHLKWILGFPLHHRGHDDHIGQRRSSCSRASPEALTTVSKDANMARASCPAAFSNRNLILPLRNHPSTYGQGIICRHLLGSFDKTIRLQPNAWFANRLSISRTVTIVHTTFLTVASLAVEVRTAATEPIS
jgi:hypothetical protein